MAKDRMNGIIVGVFYLLAAITSIIAVIFYQPILSEEWYLTATNGYDTKVLIGVLNDLLLMATAIGTAVMLFPYIRLWNEHAALGYLSFRFMEAVFIGIGVVGILALLNLSFTYEAGQSPSVEHLLPLGYMLQSFHSWTSILGPNFMLGLNTLLYSYLLYKTSIVPKPLAIFGMLTAVMVFIAGLLDMFDIIGPLSVVKGLIALPVGVYEISLASWLIFKGFNTQKLKELRMKN
jgi:hypothetical protein